MENLKKSIFILFISILSVSLIGCKPKPDENYISNEELESKEISTEDIIKDVEVKIENLVNNFDYAKIDELNVYEDPLLMEEGRNKKKYNNINIEVLLELSNDIDIRDTEQITKDYSQAIIKEFQGEDHDVDKMLEKGYFRIQELSIDYRREGSTGLPMGGRGARASFIDLKGDVVLFEVEQDEEDFKAQSLVYDYLEKNKEIDLKRIGIEDNNFIVEIKIFELQDDEYDSKLKPISDELSKLILEDDEIKDYLTGRSVKDINIYWNMMWYKGDKPIEYNYKTN